ncbi:uncharacterized protein LOC107268797 isoform X3 [Cephus cinctus]|uniref:Uncharacterized protein LOC107268797 isoform X3 n=1 Tax=Cephus cinctus TaxID=211228 RepID=A0AAJ7RIX9_CEPCN|nr:uncharacterized protein LOC107268797 isoform X3 [Cephus cinctus]
MPQCAVATCRNSHRRTRGRRIRYHRFPQIPEVRSRWVRACGRVPLSNGDAPFNIQTARICSLHFTNDSYEKDMEHLVLGLPVRSRLRRGAVPTIGVPVDVQPVTKMLVEDAKRSLLKVAHAKLVAGQKITNGAGNNEASRQNHQRQRFIVSPMKSQSPPSGCQENRQRSRSKNVTEQKMAGIDVLLALGLKPASRLNKMHAMDGAGGNGKRDDGTHGSPKVPQSQQNGAALPEEEAGVTASTTLKRIASVAIKKEPISEPEQEATDVVAELQRDVNPTRVLRSEGESRKRRSTDEGLSGNENSASKRACFEQREHFISSLVGSDKVSADELAARADQLRAEVQALDELARAKEMEWNEILSMRKLKEEAYLRIERRRQVVGYMEGNAQITKTLPPATLALGPEWDGNGSNTTTNTTSGTAANTLANKDKAGYASQECSQDGSHDGFVEESLPPTKKEKVARLQSHRQASPSPKQSENGRKQSIDSQNLENRQIGEGRQGPIVDVRSIIADYRLRHPETVPRRGRRMRNSVNVGLGAGGAMVETTGHTVDSRPSSTDSCKSNPNAVDPNSSMSFKDVLVQFAKLSQQQGEPVKTPQNYPDVTLHPVAPSPSPQNTQSQTAGSLLHGILTKSQSPRPTTFSPTLARLLTAPERERSGPAATSTPQQTTATQHLLQAYQGSNPVSISDLLSSSKARTEITITPVVNAPTVQSHSNNLIHVDDVEEETTVIEERSSRVSSGSRDNRDDRDSPPRCQGCHERAAQFVCAGCGNQWYCSRECQVSAWDEHSEVCSG